MLKRCDVVLAFTLLVPSLLLARPEKKRPEVWMGPPGFDNGRCFRELFEKADQWKDTRGMIDVLLTTDLHLDKQFTDAELSAWFPKMREWNLKLGLEVGAVKPWGQTGAKTFGIEKPMWDRIQRLGAPIYAIAMDEPLLCVRRDLKKDDDYAVAETAEYIALVRKNFPSVRVGDIEPFPSVPLEDHVKWIDAVEKKLAEKGVRGLDFYRLDVNYAEFIVFDRGTWPQVRKIEQHCRRNKIAFSLIYWASGYPALEKKGLADDSTWYVSVMEQGNNYALIDGHPDEYVIQSWLKDAPARCVPDNEEFTFTRSVHDFVTKFVPPRNVTDSHAAPPVSAP
ncbi:MAG TPA: hypothetical protein VLJ39_23100 [Tepidisphaeraceae bacterium]|nr:hypothetical protein [Tepidisphaeraceae bacterium]